VTTIKSGEIGIEFDTRKRDRTLLERGLDFARAGEVFAGLHLTGIGPRHGHEPRFVTIGRVDGALVVVVWTPRGGARRVISMRKANAREKARFARALD
jgi:uncharacterized DUF497 family protein